MNPKAIIPFISIVIPVYNGGNLLKRCLTALHQSVYTDWELIVVDDGSTDGSEALARQFDARVVATSGRLGPAAARNLGARFARGECLYFIDADCEPHPDTLTRIAHTFEANPQLDALFGSYDDAPGAPNFFAQYKNLFHHYVHQHSGEIASTFWTGCGAIRRRRFLELGGFDLQRYRRPAIEDIDLGYRLKLAGGQIHLDKDIQVKHLKAWSFLTLLRSDIFDRGIPWTRLILRDKSFMSDLNLQTHNRVSVAAVYALLLSLLVTIWYPQVLGIALGLAVLLLWLNLHLYRFFYEKRGWLFTLKVIPMHWLYYFYNGISFGCGMLLHWQERFKAEVIPPPEPLAEAIEGEGSS